MSPNVWKTLRKHIPKMRTEGYCVELTKTKDVSVKECFGMLYVSFHTTFIKDDTTVHTYINLNGEEWGKVLMALDDIDTIIKPAKILPCMECRAQCKKVHVTALKRMQDTILTPEMLATVVDSNDIAYDARMQRCTFCGGYEDDDVNECCHCHKYTCRKCEPDNFCTVCGANIIIPM